jgi:hypothetical protein
MGMDFFVTWFAGGFRGPGSTLMMASQGQTRMTPPHMMTRPHGAGMLEDPGTTHQACAQEIARLREENEELRRSARTFGELAERLHQALQRERCRALEHARQTAGDLGK